MSASPDHQRPSAFVDSARALSDAHFRVDELARQVDLLNHKIAVMAGENQIALRKIEENRAQDRALDTELLKAINQLLAKA